MTQPDPAETIHVRAATEADTEAIVKFNLRMAQETEARELDEHNLRRGVRAVFARRDKGFYVVAETGGDVIGQLLITREWSDWRNAWFWWIQSVFVREDWRRRGVYRRLYEHVKSIARRRGNVCGFRLYVETENDAARQAYERLGMQESSYRMYEE